MTIISTVEGDLLKNFKADKYFGIAHGANCQKIMGSGIALQIKEQFPMAYEADLNLDLPDLERFGKSTMAICDYGFIFNFYTQLYPGLGTKGSGGDSIANRYQAIEDCFSHLNNNMARIPPLLIAHSDVLGIPLIGCGLAGLDWDMVEEIINSCTPNLKIEVVKYKP